MGIGEHVYKYYLLMVDAFLRLVSTEGLGDAHVTQRNRAGFFFPSVEHVFAFICSSAFLISLNKEHIGSQNDALKIQRQSRETAQLVK